MMALLSPLGRAPGLSEFPQSPFLLQVHGLAGAKSFNHNRSGPLGIRPCAKRWVAFSHLLIVIPDKRELILSHFTEKDIEVQTDEVEKSPTSQLVSVPTVEPRHHGTDEMYLSP